MSLRGRWWCGLALMGACGAPAALGPPAGAASEPTPAPRETRSAQTPAAPPPRADDPCVSDVDCSYDPHADRCGADPRLNRQPPLVDQGILCYCDDARRVCARLRVEPVPCEGDSSCAIDPSPRPHPARADATHPHERGRRCLDFTLTTRCERTNICTLQPVRCRR